MNPMKKRKKLIWIPIVVLLIAGIVAAVILLPTKELSPVYVYSMNDYLAGYMSWEGNNSTSYGNVSTDRIQPVYLTETQTITEVKVTEGQKVKKGDVLFTYDTALSDLNLQKADLEIQQKKINLKNAQEELAQIRKMKPIVYHKPPATTATTKPLEEGKSPDNPENRSYLIYGGSGTQASPALCWMKSNANLSEQIMKELFENKAPNSKMLYVRIQHSKGDAANADITKEYGVIIMREDVTSEVTVDVTKPTQPTQPEPSEGDPAEDEGEQDSVVHESVKGNYTRTRYSISFFDPRNTVTSPTQPTESIDWNSGYTSAELASMKAEKEQEIKEMQFDIRMAEAEYKIMQKEADDGNVLAEFDGVVTSVMDPDEALVSGEPLMRVSGGGGYYVQGAVSEMDLDTLQIGQEVTVNAYSWWEGGGGTFIGTITEIGEYPTEDYGGYYGSGNMTYYPYKVFIDESASLRDGDYVEMTLGESTEEQVLCINNAFVINEDNGTFVYVRNAEGLLEKRQIKTRPGQWDGNTVIISGLTSEDYVAFPYDKGVQEGAPTQEGTYETLYGQSIIGY